MVEELRKEVFDSENEEHEKMLLKVSDLRFLLTVSQVYCYASVVLIQYVWFSNSM